MKPMLAFDPQNGDWDPLSSYLSHKERFALANTINPSHTVRCVQDRLTFIIESTIKSNIEFFEARQRNYLLSLVAVPITGFKDNSGRALQAAIVVDANRENHFRESDRELLEFLLNEFACRLMLESHLLTLCS